MSKSNTVFSQRLYPEAMFAVEKASYQYSANPAELTVRLRIQDVRLESHGLSSGGLDCNCQLVPSARAAFYLADKRVPFREMGKIGEEVPYSLGRCFDLDLRAYFLCQILLSDGFARFFCFIVFCRSAL